MFEKLSLLFQAQNVLHIGVGGRGARGYKSQSPADLTRGGGEMVIFLSFATRLFEFATRENDLDTPV